MSVTRGLVLAVMLCATAAHAGEAPISPRPLRPREPEREWYGYINLTCDGVAASSFILAGVNSRGDRGEFLAYLSLSTWLLGGPIAHWSHGNVGTGFGSLAMRAAMPVGSAMVGCALFGSDGEFGCLAGLLLGGLAGIVSASVIDATALAYTEPKSFRTALRLMPNLTPSRHGATFGVAAVF
jgi:hypothetical protein